MNLQRHPREVSWCWVRLRASDFEVARQARDLQLSRVKGDAKYAELHDRTARGSLRREDGFLQGIRGEIAVARLFGIELGMKEAGAGKGHTDVTTRSGICLEVKAMVKAKGWMNIGRYDIRSHVHAIVLVWLRSSDWAMALGWCLPREYQNTRQRVPGRGGKGGYWAFPTKRLRPIGTLLAREAKRPGGIVELVTQCEGCASPLVAAPQDLCWLHEKRRGEVRTPD